MSGILDPIDLICYKPVFEKSKPLVVEQALKFVMILNNGLDQTIPDRYWTIPHSISAIFYKDEEIRIDTHRTLDSQDIYMEEECLLSPPESKIDQFWRRSITRLTYLVTQFFFALLTGKNPVPPFTYSLEDIAPKPSKGVADTIQSFLHKGLAEIPNERFQSFAELEHSIQELQKKIQSTQSSSVTSFNLPKLPRLFYKNVVSPEIQPVSSRGYEIHIWNPKHEDAAKVIIDAPATVTIGRKQSSMENSTVLDVEEAKGKTVKISSEKQQRDGHNHYTILVEGDICLSRKHAKLYFPKDSLTPPSIEDLGSTHGIVVYLDSNRSMLSSTTINNGDKMPFPCPVDQYLQLGNTFFRVRLLEKDLLISIE